MIYHEQGYGDTIQFTRYLPKLYKFKDTKVIFGVQETLNKLIKYNFPNNEIISTLDDNLKCDYSLPLMSIPYKFDINNIKPLKQYLKVDAKDIKNFQQKHIIKKTFNIGIVWQGSQGHNKDKKRSLKLSYFERLLDIPNTTLYSLQIKDNEEIENTNIINLGQHFNDFYDTAVAIKSLDLIISIDTSVIHLAGALGKECWVLISHHPDWRWGLNTTTNDWYKSITLFRQIDRSNWDIPFENIIKKISNEQ